MQSILKSTVVRAKCSQDKVQSGLDVVSEVCLTLYHPQIMEVSFLACNLLNSLHATDTVILNG